MRLESQTDVKGWRDAARRLRLSQIAPDHIRWGVGADAALFADDAVPEASPGASFTAPKGFLNLAASVLLNRANDRFDLMYRLLWRLKDEAQLLNILTDPDVDRAQRYRKAVWQAEHKMHAFLRFRRVDSPDPTTGKSLEDTEEYAAWFEPPHYILEPACAFFVRRMANVKFSILTPYASAFWDKQVLRYGDGADATQVPAEDAKEKDWLAYFSSVFNPARLNPKVMVQHMAKHYWRNLPEAELIPQMIETAEARAAAMVAATPTLPSERAMKIAARRSRDEPIDGGITPETLAMLAAGVQHCRRCDLWRDATQGVIGEGPSRAAILVVGEQPGDLEDLRGRPFVGPAGALFDRALAEAGIARETLYITNAVKHFKHEMRGKRRLHKTPNAGEAKACRWWLSNELRLVNPKVVLALGSTAATAVLKRPVSVLKERGAAEVLEQGGRGFITVHPSYLLRIPDEEAKREGFKAFVRDLAAAKTLAMR